MKKKCTGVKMWYIHIWMLKEGGTKNVCKGIPSLSEHCTKNKLWHIHSTKVQSLKALLNIIK